MTDSIVWFFLLVCFVVFFFLLSSELLDSVGQKLGPQDITGLSSVLSL